MKINILGQEYKILLINENKIPDDLKAKLENNIGLCENYTKELIITKLNPSPQMYKRSDLLEEKVGRHELLHAYLFNSGISQLISKDNEEALVDMLAINLENIWNNSEKIKEYLRSKRKYNETHR